MSTVILDINRALETAVAAILSPILGASNIEFPNIDYVPVEGTPWARVSHLPGGTSPSGIGVNALTRRPGILQVTLFYPTGKGTKDVLTTGQAVLDGFKRGSRFTKGTTSVLIERASPGPFINEPGRVGYPLSINWVVRSID